MLSKLKAVENLSMKNLHIATLEWKIRINSIDTLSKSFKNRDHNSFLTPGSVFFEPCMTPTIALIYLIKNLNHLRQSL